MDRETYLFHQTPRDLCKKLIEFIPIQEGDILLEAFAGENNFFDNFPTNTINRWCEIERGVCYTSYTDKIDWVISNPPFRLETGNKRVNSFYYLIDYYSTRVDKGICFLANYSCFNTLTPKRMNDLNNKGLYLTKVITCNVKKWSNRYYFLIFTKTPNDNFKFILGTY